MVIQVTEDDIAKDDPLGSAINRALEKKRTKIRVKVGTLWIHLNDFQSIMLPRNAYKWNISKDKQPFRFELKYDFENNRHG